MTKAFRFGISEFTTMPWSFEEDVERYAALGVDAIEDKLDPDRLDEQFARITDAGLAISGMQPSVRTFLGSRMVPQPLAANQRLSRLRDSVERLARYVPGRTVY